MTDVHPTKQLQARAADLGVDAFSSAFAAKMDADDALSSLRSEFHVPHVNVDGSDTEAVYLCGNSLGLQPKKTEQYVLEELRVWQNKGVEGHFDADHPRPWARIEETVDEMCAHVLGAKRSEVTVMNSLTVNVHLMMVSFYRPTAQRFKVVVEGKAFPSDQYAVDSQVRFHGYEPKDAVIELMPREGEKTLRTEDILRVIEEEGDSIAMIMLGAINYYTGQFFDVEAITKAGHAKGCAVGFDLAHAAGNIDLQLHDWDVDVACFCSYKYLNSGPGSIAGLFVHEKHATADLPRFAGWWGHDKESRFDMGREFQPIPGAAGFQLSNPAVLPVVSLLASVELFEKATMASLRAKSYLLTGYLELLLMEQLADHVEIITPHDPKARGCQLSLVFAKPIEEVFKCITAKGVICDMRKPNVMRIAPTPMYNTFSDVFRFVHILKEALQQE